jgi:hypothetical protein
MSCTDCCVHVSSRRCDAVMENDEAAKTFISGLASPREAGEAPDNIWRLGFWQEEIKPVKRFCGWRLTLTPENLKMKAPSLSASKRNHP